MDNWRILDFTDFSGWLRYRRGRLVACPDDGAEQSISLSDVATVLIGLHVGLGPTVTQQLAAFDVVLLACDWNGVPGGALTAWTDHGRVGARHLAQFEMTVPRRKNAWGQVVRAKVKGQAATLRALGQRDWRHVDDMARLVRSGDPENIEARAARYYWSRVFEGFVRQPGARMDNRNSMLDYGYAVLRGWGIRAVVSAGLSPSLGLFHHGRGNTFNLVDDLIEPFRPAIDYVVATLPADMSINHPAVKHRLVAASAQPFSDDGLSVSATLADLAQRLGMYAEGKSPKLDVPCWHGPINMAPPGIAA